MITKIYKCGTCHKISGVELFPNEKTQEEVYDDFICIKCYNKSCDKGELL